MLTNREIIDQAYTEIGLGLYAYEKQAEDYQSSLIRLRALLSEWTASGAAGGYSGGDLDDDSGIPSDGERGVICGLAMDLAPSFGKATAPETKIAARRGKRLMMRKSMNIPRRATSWQDIPAGAGWKYEDRINFAQHDPDVTPDERYENDN